jgi:hypothetical protein
MRQYVELFSFANMTFDEALRKFLAGFRIPGEAQKIDRIMVRTLARPHARPVARTQAGRQAGRRSNNPLLLDSARGICKPRSPR